MIRNDSSFSHGHSVPRPMGQIERRESNRRCQASQSRIDLPAQIPRARLLQSRLAVPFMPWTSTADLWNEWSRNQAA